MVHGHDIQYVQFFVHILEGPKGKCLHAYETEMPCALLLGLCGDQGRVSPLSQQGLPGVKCGGVCAWAVIANKTLT
jgi:hypothetical protein